MSAVKSHTGQTAKLLHIKLISAKKRIKNYRSPVLCFTLEMSTGLTKSAWLLWGAEGDDGSHGGAASLKTPCIATHCVFSVCFFVF